MLYLILVILVLFILLITYFFIIAFVRMNKADIENLDAKKNESLKPYSEILKNGMKFFDEIGYKQYQTFSYDGLKLNARYYNQGSDITILLFHGYRSTAKHDFSCAVKMYFDKGFNILLVDQRAAGESEGRLITFGVKESRDVISWIEFLNAKFEPKKIILSGLSMGATTVLLSLRYQMPENVKCVIADCGFTSPVAIIKKVAKQNFKIDATPFIPILDFLCKIFGKFSIKNISTVDTVKDSKIPILLIHGKNDNFVPCEMSQATYRSTNKKSKLILVDGADHGISFLVDTKLVTDELDRFLNENLC